MWRILIGIVLGIAIAVGGYIGFGVWQARQAASVVVRAPVKPAAVVAALKAQTKLFRRRIERVTPTVEVAIGYGLANVILIEAPRGLILVDALESVDAANDLKPWIDKRRRETGKDITHLGDDALPPLRRHHPGDGDPVRRTARPLRAGRRRRPRRRS